MGHLSLSLSLLHPASFGPSSNHLKQSVHGVWRRVRCTHTHVTVSSSAVFGSYLRPDLVPANPSFYEGSSMGTISTSSIFVGVDHQTEDRWVSLSPTHLPAASIGSLPRVDLKACVCSVSSHNQDSCGLEYKKGRHVNMHCPTHARDHTRPRKCHLTSHDPIGDVRHGAGDSVGLATRTQYTYTLTCTHAYTLHMDRSVRNEGVRIDLHDREEEMIWKYNTNLSTIGTMVFTYRNKILGSFDFILLTTISDSLIYLLDLLAFNQFFVILLHKWSL